MMKKSLRRLWHTVVATYRAARDKSKDRELELAKLAHDDAMRDMRAEHFAVDATDDVCGPHHVYLECSCVSPIDHPELWRDPGCAIHSDPRVVN